jgi:hypothetical protein
MKTIIQRVQELKGDPSLSSKGISTIAALSFTPVDDTMTGEQFALTLATIIAYGEKQLPAQATSVQVDDTPAGKVYNASIQDGVSVTERIGG